MNPFKDALPIPSVPAPDKDSNGNVIQVDLATNPDQTDLPFAQPKNGSLFQKHQIPDNYKTTGGQMKALRYTLELKVAGHSFTSSPVLPIDVNGQPVASFDATGKTYPAGTVRQLPESAIYGFNGTFPGPAIHAKYGTPAIVRFQNNLNVAGKDKQGNLLPRGDFGSPDQTFLTHLHNGHTAPESDGNPHYFFKAFKDAKDPRTGNDVTGYPPGKHVDNLYLNWPAEGDDTEKQSFFWFHDHRMDQTGSNVYKGMVGLYPIYDPKDYSKDAKYLAFNPDVKPGGLDNGNEAEGLQLPGLEYDIPLAFYDCRLDDGVTTHHDIHDGEFTDVDNNNAPIPGNQKHPEWWGRTFYKHFPNHGFVGDIFTVNGKAYPTLEVKRRKYRFRFLDCSLARIYEFKLMKSAGGPKSAAKDLKLGGDELQGQWRIPDGQQCMKFLQVASDGGLLPEVIERDSFELWPAKRREMVVDFTKYQDGSPTANGDVIYLTDVMKMTTGRMWSSSTRFSPDPNFKVPVLAFKIGDDAPDASVVSKGKKLRPLPQMKVTPNQTDLWKKAMDNRLIFEAQRGGAGGELEWMINGQPFDPKTQLASLQNPAGQTPQAKQPKDSFALWEIRNGGGGWVHPFHLHMEEHRTVMRNGRMMIKGDGTQIADAGHPDDGSREDLVALDPSESTIIYRSFRDFKGDYVAHCHNLAHEDHAMMFGWSIT
jgi:FtsP/CotA-like multicopper oxidase with cupredoxin domain